MNDIQYKEKIPTNVKDFMIDKKKIFPIGIDII